MDAEDREADRVYAAIDRRMDSRRRARREAAAKLANEEFRKKRPKIQEQFRDLKRELGGLSESDWDAIPEALDHTRRRRATKKSAPRFQNYTPVPDRILRQAGLGSAGRAAVGGGGSGGSRSASSGLVTPAGWSTPAPRIAAPGSRRVAASGFATPAGWATPGGIGLRRGWQTPAGMATPAGTASESTATGQKDLTQLGRARDKMLGIKLDRVADSVSGQTVVDPKGYLTDMNATVQVQSTSAIQDIKKARLLLKSVITTNPKHGPGWIAAARLEYETGKVVAARALILKGCDTVPKDVDVWLEAVVMHSRDSARAILAKAVRHLPTSKKIWLAAVDLEEAVEKKKAVLRRALELIPRSVDLWKAAVELEAPDDARVMLSRAVELIPTSVELWLALARLETYDNARKILNRARKAVPTDPLIWITAAKLEEAQGKHGNVPVIIKKAISSLEAHRVRIDRDSWLAQAERAERSGSKLTCQAIVMATVGIGVDPQDQRSTWKNDAQRFEANGSIETTRAIFAHLLAKYPRRRQIWELAAAFERRRGDSQSLDALLQRAVKHCPQAEILWLMWAKERWTSGSVEGARQILTQAFAANTDSEDIWIAAVKLEVETKEFARARGLLAKARQRAGTDRIWMKSAALERRLGDDAACLGLLQEACKLYPRFDKLWMMRAQLHAGRGESKDARMVFKQGVKTCPRSVALWRVYAGFEADNGSYARARSLLETARAKVPRMPKLWLAAIRIEERAGNRAAAGQLMAKALQECPKSGELWAHAIATDPPPARKSRSYSALERCIDDPHVFLCVAKLFWQAGKQRKARVWFNRALAVDSDLGDVWAWFYRFEKDQGRKDRIQRVVKKCIQAEPAHGERWCAVSKKVANEGLKTEAILKKVEALLPVDVFAVAN